MSVGADYPIDKFSEIVAGLGDITSTGHLAGSAAVQLEVPEIPDKCRDCPWAGEAVDAIGELSEANQVNKDALRIFSNGSDSAQRVSLEETISGIAERVSGKAEPLPVEISGLEFVAFPDESAESMTQRFLEAVKSLASRNDKKIRGLRESVVEATGKCATGAVVWRYVEVPDGALVQFTCNAPQGTAHGDEDDGNLRIIDMTPKKLSKAEWARYRPQTEWPRG